MFCILIFSFHFNKQCNYHYYNKVSTIKKIPTIYLQKFPWKTETGVLMI
jgi:hypothetical protein